MARVWQPYHLSVTNVGSNLIIKYTVLVWSECGIIGASKRAGEVAYPGITVSYYLISSTHPLLLAARPIQ